MKFLLLGDVHGVSGCLRRAIMKAEELGLDAIFQVGDFGYWPRSGTTRKSYIATASGSSVPVYWLPGNHEDWDDYEAFLEATDDYDDDGFAMWGAMRISPKVHSWEWDGLKFGVLGGAYSVDRSLRTLGESYFDQEIPEWSDVDKLPDKLDVLLTHEAPLNIAHRDNWRPLPVHWEVDWDLSTQSQAVIRAAITKTDPGLLVHGHWHYRTEYYAPGSDTLCLGLDQATGDDYDCMAIFDTEAKALYNLFQFQVEGIRPTWQAS